MVETTTELDGFLAQVGALDRRLTILGGVGLAIGVKHKADFIKIFGALRYAAAPPAVPVEAIGKLHLCPQSSSVEDPDTGDHETHQPE